MPIKRVLALGASFAVTSFLAVALPGPAIAQETKPQYVQVAEIEIEPSQLEAYRAAVNEQIETAVRVEPGVLVLYAVAERDNPARVRVFEIYRDADAYRSHLETAHFQKYKSTTEKMVKSLNLVVATPISMGSK
jgi:quinol monooxygenase YgiN